MQELLFILDAAPFDKLYPTLIPTTQSRYSPPVFHYGWQIDVDAFLRLAATRGIRKYRTDPDYKGKKPRRYFDAYRTMDALAALVLRENNIKLQDQIPLKPSLRPGRVPALVFSLHDNYHMKVAHTAEQIEKLKVALGFEGPPKWYVDGFEFYWNRDDGASIS